MKKKISFVYFEIFFVVLEFLQEIFKETRTKTTRNENNGNYILLFLGFLV